MEKENVSLKTFIDILLDSLENKYALLQSIEEKTKAQAALLKSRDMKLKDWDALVDEKADLIEKINHMDAGFETLYDRLRVDLMEQKTVYQCEVKSMQFLIQKIMEKSSSIQVLEERNKVAMEQFFKGEKKQTMVNKTATYVTSSYSNAKNNKNSNAPHFFDAKK